MMLANYSDLILSEIKFEIGTHHLVSPNKIKKYSQRFNLESSLATFVNNSQSEYI